jgi:hypothetical protein
MLFIPLFSCTQHPALPPLQRAASKAQLPLSLVAAREPEVQEEGEMQGGTNWSGTAGQGRLLGLTPDEGWHLGLVGNSQPLARARQRAHPTSGDVDFLN